MRAIVRPPGESFENAVSEGPRSPIDVTLAWEQHAGYRDALRAAGLDLIELPPDEEHPDACFVQDTAVVFGRLAVMARFGVRSRQGEQDAVSRALDRKPETAFDLVAVHPKTGSTAQVILNSSAARRNAESVLRTLVDMGLPATRVNMTSTPSASAQSNEVRVYVR